MKNLAWTVSILVSLLAAAAFGQAREAMELSRSIIQTEKKAIVASNMLLSEQESEAFWPLYNDYQNELRKVGDRWAKLITDYAKNYETLSDDQAQSMLKDFFDVEEARLKLRKSYVKKFEKVLPQKKLTRYYQIENKLEAVIKYELAAAIPLVK